MPDKNKVASKHSKNEALSKEDLKFQDMNLNCNLLKGILLQFAIPNEVQSKTLQLIVKEVHSNILISSRPGSGKTISAIIGILERLVKSRTQRALLICPTSDLAKKAYNYAVSLAKFCPEIKIRRAIEKDNVIRKITENLIIGTPIKIADFGSEVKSIGVVVINEANLVIEQKGHRKNIERIFLHLPNRCQFILCCASQSKDLDAFVDKNEGYWDMIKFPWKSPKIEIKYFVFKERQEKMDFIINCLSLYPAGQTVIFAKEKEYFEQIREKLSLHKITAAVLHGKLKSEHRDDVMRLFAERAVEVLVTNSSFANVINSSGVSKIFNLDQLVNENENHELDIEAYRRRESLMFDKKRGLIINFIDKGWKDHLLKGISQENIIYSPKAK